MRNTSFLAAALCWLAACDSGTQPNDVLGSQFVVSNPVPASLTGSPANDPVATSPVETVVFVSLPAGSIPSGIEASISNRRSAVSSVVSLVNGGIDPARVPAGAGDTLDISVRTGGNSSLHFVLTVPLRARPIVVRTDPPLRKRDVPLNAAMLIVFSEPIDASSLNGTAIQLRSGAAPVPGQLEFADPAHLSVLFVPAAPLSGMTDYTLVVTSEIRDLSGASLEATYISSFTTGRSSGGVRVQVTTEGDDPDADGYVLLISSNTSSDGVHYQYIGVNGTATLGLPYGTWSVALGGLQYNCVLQQPGWYTVLVGADLITELAFHIVCPAAAPNSLLVSVATQVYGTGWPPFDFRIRVDAGAELAISANGSLVINPVAPGAHTVKLVTGWPDYGFITGCHTRVLGKPNVASTVTIAVPAGGVGRVSYSVVCIP